MIPKIPAFQDDLFPDVGTNRYKENLSSTFTGNMRLPVHRWFRYSAGFSGAWAADLIAREAARRNVCVLDPFAGSGTALIAAEQCGVEAWGIDPHPFVARVTQAKLAYRSSPIVYLQRARQSLMRARLYTPSLESYAPLIRQCYTNEALAQLDGLRHVIENDDDDSESARLVWLTLASILRKTSHVGTANWQYLLPRRRKRTKSVLCMPLSSIPSSKPYAFALTGASIVFSYCLCSVPYINVTRLRKLSVLSPHMIKQHPSPVSHAMK